MIKITNFIFFFFLILTSHGQVVYQHISNTNIYDFLDELANEKIIEINSAVKPYSRSLIAEKLQEAKQKSEFLNKRQKSELFFYLKDYIKEINRSNTIQKLDFFTSHDSLKRADAFFYQDSFFTFSINPIVGVNVFSNNQKLHFSYKSGVDLFGYIGKNLGFYASLRDNFESVALSNASYLNQETGAEYKYDSKGGGEFSEMRGGITYGNKWASLGLIKDHFAWGNNNNGANIFSGKTPSFAQVVLKITPVKWFEFNYVHGYLISGLIDSANSYIVNGVTRDVYHEKLLTANFFTFKPIKNLFLSFGNSVIYSNVGSNPVYLIPLFFYKSLDHTHAPQSNNGGQNAQMFMDISSRNIKHIHLYSSLYIDEISTFRMFDENTQSNFVSGKLGVKINNFGVENLFFIAEFTRTNPIVYKHYIATTTFESSRYVLGHYLRDNSKEYYLSLFYKPIPKLNLKFSYTNASVGNNYPDIRSPNLVWGLPFQKEIKWKNSSYAFKIDYEIKNDFHVNASFTNSNITGDDAGVYSPVFLIGNHNTMSFGCNFGF